MAKLPATLIGKISSRWPPNLYQHKKTSAFLAETSAKICVKGQLWQRCHFLQILFYLQLPVFTIRNRDFRTAAKISRYETTFWGDFGFSTKYQSCYASVSRCPFHIGIRVLTFSPGFSFNLSSQFVSQATKQDVDRVSGYLATYPSLSITIIRKVLLVRYQRSWRKA